MTVNKVMRSVARFFRLNLLSRFLVRFPGKYTLNLTTIGWASCSLCLIAAIGYALFSDSKDTSFLGRSNTKFGFEQKAKESGDITPAIKGISQQNGNDQSDEALPKDESPRSQNKRVSIKYKASQVLLRDDAAMSGRSLPVGANFVGRLVAGIDSRFPSQRVEISLPFGGSFRGQKPIPDHSSLFATAHYAGSGDIVHLEIDSGTYPDGRGFKIKAQALRVKGFVPGLKGDYHGTFGNRVASALGLTFVSSVTEIMQEKEVLENAYTATPKSTFKNGILNGVSTVAKREGSRIAGQLGTQKPYVTIEAGKELIVSLTEPFIGTY